MVPFTEKGKLEKDSLGGEDGKLTFGPVSVGSLQEIQTKIWSRQLDNWWIYVSVNSALTMSDNVQGARIALPGTALRGPHLN